MGRILVWAGVVLFVVAWFVPVHTALSASDALSPALDDVVGGTDLVRGLYRGPHGWRACRAAWDLLSADGAQRKGFEVTLLGLTPLLNLAMVAAIGSAALGRSAARARRLGLVLLGAFVWSLGWLYWTDGEFRAELRAGYWMWAASFALVGTALLGARD